MKAAEVTPIFMTNNDLDKEDYRPASVLPHVSKVFERIMYIQNENFVKGKLSKLLTGFRKVHAIQYSLVNILEKCLIKLVLYVSCSWTCQKSLTQWSRIC